MPEYTVTAKELNRLIHRVRIETLDTIAISLVKEGGWSIKRIERAMQVGVKQLSFGLDAETLEALLFAPDSTLDDPETMRAAT